MVALSDAQKKANEKYIKNDYKQVKLSMPNAEAEALERYCEIKSLTKADGTEYIIDYQEDEKGKSKRNMTEEEKRAAQKKSEATKARNVKKQAES